VPTPIDVQCTFAPNALGSVGVNVEPESTQGTWDRVGGIIGHIMFAPIRLSFAGLCVALPLILAKDIWLGFALLIVPAIPAILTCLWMPDAGSKLWHWYGVTLRRTFSLLPARWRLSLQSSLRPRSKASSHTQTERKIRPKPPLHVNIAAFTFGLIPYSLICWIISKVIEPTDPGSIFWLVVLCLTLAQILLKLIAAAWHGFFYVLFGDYQVQAFAGALIARGMPEPEVGENDAPQYFQRVMWDQDVEMRVRMQAALEWGDLGGTVRTAGFARGMIEQSVRDRAIVLMRNSAAQHGLDKP
jgi:hypothetical protein